MTWFNKFIAFISLTAIMLLGVLAIHSIKVDTLPIDYSLGLISKNRSAFFTIKAEAQLASEPSLIRNTAVISAIEAARQATSQTIGGILNMIKATLKAVMKVVQMIKKVLNFIITLLQKFSGRDISLYGILSAVQSFSSIDGMFSGFETEFNQIWTDYGAKIQNSQTQIALGQENITKVSNIYNACIAVTLMEENGEKANVDKNQLCNLAIKSKVSLQRAVAVDKNAGPNSGVSAVSEVFNTPTRASSQTLNADGTLSTPSATAESSATATNSAIAGPLNLVMSNFGGVADSDKYAGLTEQSILASKIAEVRSTNQNMQKQAEEAEKFTPGCGAYIGPIADQNLSISTNPNTTIKGFTVAPTAPTVFNANSGSIGVAPASANFGLDVSQYKRKAFTLDQCNAVKDSATANQNIINQANQTTSTGETSGGIAQVVAALQSVFEVIQTIQEVFQQIMGFVKEIMSVGQSFMSEFGGLLSSIGNVFGEAGAGGASQAGILSAAINNTGTIGQAGNLAVLDDGRVTINDASISANVDNIQKYSDLSIDCVTDAVKFKSVAFTTQYKADINATINPDSLPVVGSNNIKTYTNGSNVPDGVMGASVNDSNTPGMAGITYRRTDGTNGTVPTTPSRSLIASGSATGNINSTYHQCQSSPWSDDNSVDTAAKRLAYYPADAKYGGPSVYRDGVSNDWRAVNNVMSKEIPDQCYLTNNDLSSSDKQSIISALGINYNSGGNDLDKAWQEAKTRVDQAQREGKARWNPDPSLIYVNRVTENILVGDKNVAIKPGRCEVAYTKGQVDSALQSRGWSFNRPEPRSFAKLVSVK